MDQSSRLLHHVRILVVELLVVALGVLTWEAFGRRILTFKYGSLGSSVTCSPDVDRALADFDGGLRMSAVVGALACVAVTIALRLWWGRRHSARAADVKK